MVTKNEMPFILLLLINILEDFQLTFFSWRPELFSGDNGFKYVQYIFNPVYYLVKNFTLPVYIIAFALFVALAALMAYCTSGLVLGRLKQIWTLQLLRILTILMSTVLFLPVIEALAQPLTCTLGNVTGFSVRCDDNVRIALYVASAIGAAFIIPYGSLMSLLYFEPSPKSVVGKATGRIDLMYVWVRVILVIINNLTSTQVSSIVGFVLIGALALAFLFQQPFYNDFINRARFSLFFSAWVVTICSIAGSFSDLQTDFMNTFSYSIATLIIGFASIPIGFLINIHFVRHMNKKTYAKLQQELNQMNGLKQGDVKVRKSQLELIYSNVDEVVNTEAMERKVKIFFNVFWSEISARFVRRAYLSEKAVTLTLQLFEMAFEQFPKSAHLHLMYLEYIKEFLPQVQDHKVRHIQFLHRRCK